MTPWSDHRSTPLRSSRDPTVPTGALDVAGETVALSAAIPDAAGHTFLGVAHAERVVAGETIEMTEKVAAKPVLDVGNATYFYLSFNELGPSGAPLVPKAPTTTPEVRLTVDLEFAE